jgi:DNA-directed RNA polymerase beta subunit
MVKKSIKHLKNKENNNEKNKENDIIEKNDNNLEMSDYIKNSYEFKKGKSISFKIGDYSIDPNDIYLVGDTELEAKGLIHHHLESINELYDIGLKQIITQVFKIEKTIEEYDLKPALTLQEKQIESVHLEIKFSDVHIKRPVYTGYESGSDQILFPNMALRMEKTYKSVIEVSADIIQTINMKNGEKKIRNDKLLNFKLCKIPVMVGSKLCHKYGKDKKTLIELKEDPTDPGGYFIINGVEWAIDCVEAILFNKLRIFKNEGYQKEIIHAHIISKPGDYYLNSDEFIIRWLKDNQITIEIKRDRLKNKLFPFYVIFRLLGWGSDKLIYEYILQSLDDPISKMMGNYLDNAFNAKYQFMPKSENMHLQEELLRYYIEEVKSEYKSYDLKSEESKNKLMQDILNHIDLHFLPHIGMTAESRHKKLHFLALGFRKLFLTYMGILEPTDRDSFNSKRVHAAGTSYAKVFKTYLNASVIQRIKRFFTKVFKNQSAFEIPLRDCMAASVNVIDFERVITQAITAGNKSEITINKKARINRLSSQQLSRKNQLSVYSILRGITTTSADNAKQSERANEIRRVHMSFLGYICIIHSPEGEKVGINKQLAIFASITRATLGEVIKSFILNDPECIPLSNVLPIDIYEKKLCNIYVNGDWIGLCNDAFEFTIKYRQKRRNFEINPEISIVWDKAENEIYFWSDVGRVIRPLLIVYNNKRDSHIFPTNEKYSEKKQNFKQGLALTQKHIDGILSKTINIEDLLRENIIEYISADEQENLYICSSFDKLIDMRNDELNEFTHCDIPQAILGLTALTSPYANHNQTPRIVFQTSQVRQTCGIHSLNWPFRYDKEGFLQYRSETPLVKTISNHYLFPNGCMAIVAIACNTGYNQEDSLVIAQGAIDRGMFNGCKLTFYKTKVEQKETIENPSINTEKMRIACYDKLVNGIVTKGTIINKDDALIGKVAKVSSGERSYKYIDRSVIYKDIEPAIVHDVLRIRNEQDEDIVKVVLRKMRPVSIGDKFSSRSGQKTVVGVTLSDSDMPRTIDGIMPSFIINPHCIPSRMTLGQLYESQIGNWAAKKGNQTDGTFFHKIDIESIGNELEELGLDRCGYHRLYNGFTGEWIDTEIFMGPTFYQRLQKFVVDTVYKITQGPSDPITYIPVDGGKGTGGGLRIGEMEKDVFISHGNMRCLSEKFFSHADGTTLYICRCGKPAIVNLSQNPPIIKCKYCLDNAQIYAVPSSWSSKLMTSQEIPALNIGVRTIPEAFTFERNAIELIN